MMYIVATSYMNKNSYEQKVVEIRNKTSFAYDKSLNEMDKVVLYILNNIDLCLQDEEIFDLVFFIADDVEDFLRYRQRNLKEKRNSLEQVLELKNYNKMIEEVEDCKQLLMECGKKETSKTNPITYSYPSAISAARRAANRVMIFIQFVFSHLSLYNHLMFV